MEPKKIKRTAHSRRRHLFALSSLLCLGVLFNPFARAVEWEFKPPQIGLALTAENPNGTNWMVQRRLGTVPGGVEFAFPLQLCYSSVRTERGLFADNWFIPQLESKILPRGKNVLIWTTPWGAVEGLILNEKQVFADHEKKFSAKVAGNQTTIISADNWLFKYRDGLMELAQAPSGRQLDFVYRAGKLAQVVYRDPVTNTAKPLLALGHNARNLVTQLVIGDAQIQGTTLPSSSNAAVLCQFDYQNGPDGRLAWFTRPGVTEPERIEYDQNGVLSAVKSPGGYALTLKTEYAKLDRNKQPDPNPKEHQKPGNYRLLDDGAFSYSYDKEGAVTVKDRTGGWSSYGLSTKRNMETSRDSAGNEVVKYYYKAPGRKHDGKLNRIEKNGRVVLENFYDKRTGQLTESRDGNGVSTFYEYADPTNKNPLLSDKPSRITRGKAGGKLEVLTTFQYDQAGRVIAKIEPGSGPTKPVGDSTKTLERVTRFAYNQRGELESVFDPNGIRTVLRRDAQGRVTSASSGEQEESLLYDDAGRVKRRTLADGQMVEFAYDPAGGISEVKQNSVTVTKYQRDKSGAVVAQTDAIGRTTKWERDEKGLLLSETRPNGVITKYEYDAAGHRTAQIDGKGNKVTFQYDIGGRLVKQTNPLGDTLAWTYDDKGHLIARTNGVQNVQNTYNDKGKLKLIDYGVPGEKVVYTYDEQGRIKKIATPTNSITLFYDERDRIVVRQLNRGEPGSPGSIERVVRYTWDTFGRKTSVALSQKFSDPQNSKKPAAYKLLQQTDYSYDSKGRLAELKSNGASVCRYQYDKNGRLFARQYGNGITARYQYDRFGRQTRLDLSGGPLAEPLLLAYQWDNAGQLLSRTWNKETQVYGYDASGQLLSVNKVGSATAQAVASSASNPAGIALAVRSSANGAVPLSLLEAYRYDPAGNMLSKSEGGIASLMRYNADNQLLSTAVSQPAATEAQTTAYQYDAAGRRTGKAIAGQKQTRIFGFFDKLLILTRPDGTRIGFDYYPDGMLAAKAPLPSDANPATSQGQQNAKSGIKQQTVGRMISTFLGSKSEEESLETNPDQTALNKNLREEFVWDGLALLYKNGTTYAVEPHVSGGIPVASTAGGDAPSVYYINDILGTTLALVADDQVKVTPLSAFGNPAALRQGGASPVDTASSLLPASDPYAPAMQAPSIHSPSGSPQVRQP